MASGWSASLRLVGLTVVAIGIVLAVRPYRGTLPGFGEGVRFPCGPPAVEMWRGDSSFTFAVAEGSGDGFVGPGGCRWSAASRAAGAAVAIDIGGLLLLASRRRARGEDG